MVGRSVTVWSRSVLQLAIFSFLSLSGAFCSKLQSIFSQQNTWLWYNDFVMGLFLFLGIGLMPLHLHSLGLRPDLKHWKLSVYISKPKNRARGQSSFQTIVNSDHRLSEPTSILTLFHPDIRPSRQSSIWTIDHRTFVM